MYLISISYIKLIRDLIGFDICVHKKICNRLSSKKTSAFYVEWYDIDLASFIYEYLCSSLTCMIIKTSYQARIKAEQLVFSEMRSHTFYVRNAVFIKFKFL